MKLVTLKKEYNLVLKETLTEYLTPNMIYLEINDLLKNNIKVGDYIYKDQKITNFDYSPISGRICGIKKIKNKNYLLIENDFKEKTKEKRSIRKNFNKMTKEELLNLLSEYDLNIYNKFNSEYQRIIINGIEEQPYIGNYIFILKKYSKDLLDLVEELNEILNLKNNLFLLKDTDYMNINCLNNIIGMYPSIHLQLLPDKYLISKKEILIKQLNLNENFLYLNIEELYNLYNYLIRKKIKEDKFVTISGDAINNPQVIKCKIGTPFKNIVDELIQLNTKDYSIILNSLINKEEILTEDLIISTNVHAIFIMKRKLIETEKCIRCGKCNEVCPEKIDLYGLINQKTIKKINCSQCGLCNYICPSFINFTKYLNGDKNE